MSHTIEAYIRLTSLPASVRHTDLLVSIAPIESDLKFAAAGDRDNWGEGIYAAFCRIVWFLKSLFSCRLACWLSIQLAASWMTAWRSSALRAKKLLE